MSEMITEKTRVQVETWSGEILGSYRRVPQWSLGHDRPRLACFNSAGCLVSVVGTIAEAREIVIESNTGASIPFVEKTETEPMAVAS